MPLTGFQRDVLRLLAVNRGPESFIAGGTAIHIKADSPRYSDDVAIFHDAQESVIAAVKADTAVLAQAGFAVEHLAGTAGFQRVFVSRDGQGLKLEWVHDSAFRFFPVQEDAEFGWRLHLADLATNKVLALAGRWKVRDFVDTLYLDGSFASLGLLAWAAAAKDPGFTPLFILETANRFSRVRPEELQTVAGPGPFDLVAMKMRWRAMLDEARELVSALPPEEVGALYLNAEDRPVDPRSVPGARIHYASLGGALPQVVGNQFPLPEEAERQADEQLRQRYQRGR